MRIILEFPAVEEPEKVKMINGMIDDLINRLKRENVRVSTYNHLIVPNFVKGG